MKRNHSDDTQELHRVNTVTLPQYREIKKERSAGPTTHVVTMSLTVAAALGVVAGMAAVLVSHKAATSGVSQTSPAPVVTSSALPTAVQSPMVASTPPAVVLSKPARSFRASIHPTHTLMVIVTSTVTKPTPTGVPSSNPSNSVSTSASAISSGGGKSGSGPDTNTGTGGPTPTPSPDTK